MEGPELMVGFAKCDITPPVGEELSGYIAREQPSAGVLDPLQAGAVVFWAEDGVAVIVTADLVGFSQQFVDSVRLQASQLFGITAQSIAFAASHSHATPALNWFRHLGQPTPAYVQSVEQKILQAIEDALNDLLPAFLSIARGKVSGFNRNRRRPDGPLDEEAILLAVSRPDARTHLVLLHFTSHPVCLDHLNRLISADYVGVLRRSLEQQMTEGTSVLFLQGCAGDINPMERGVEWMQKMGEGIADGILGFGGTSRVRETPLRAVLKKVRLPLNREVTLEIAQEHVARYIEELSQAQASGEQVKQKVAAAMLDWAQELQQRIETGTLPDDPEVDVQVIRLGDVAFVFLPCEPFCELGLTLKAISYQPSAISQIIPVGYSNGLIGYIGPAHEYERPGYELDVACRYYGLLTFRPDAAEVMMQTCQQALAECRN